jgi:hypothetical protein
MALSLSLEEGGSATGDLITDESHDPGCGGGMVRRSMQEEQSTSVHNAN